MAIDTHFYDDDVRRLRTKASLDLSTGIKHHLLNTKKQITKLRQEMYPYRNITEVGNQRQQLFDTIGRINDKLDEINQERVQCQVESAATNVRFAQANLDYPPVKERADWLAERIHSLAMQAVYTLQELMKERYLKPFLAPHAESIKTTRAAAEQFKKRDREELCQTITRRQATLAAAQIAEEEHQRAEEAARLKQEQEERDRVIARKAEYARTILAEFNAAMDAKNADAAKSAYMRFEAYGADVHAACFPHPKNPAMEVRRMLDRARGLRSQRVPILV